MVYLDEQPWRTEFLNHCLKGYSNLKKDVKPVFKKAGLVPFSLKKVLEKELDRWTKDDIMTPVMHSELASPWLGLVRTTKVSVNPVLDIDQYPLPSIKGIFATLSGSAYSSKLDFFQCISTYRG